MNQIRQPYSHSFKVAMHLILALAIGFGAAVPQAAAYLGCKHACCTAAADDHRQHEIVQISDPPHPSCCGPAAAGACRLCDAERLPPYEIAMHCAASRTTAFAGSIAIVKRNPLSDLAPKVRTGWKTITASLFSRPLYLQTLTLLI